MQIIDTKKGFISIIIALVILAVGSVALYELGQSKLGGSLTAVRYGGTGKDFSSAAGFLRLTAGAFSTTSLTDADIPDDITITSLSTTTLSISGTTTISGVFIIATSTSVTVGAMPAGTIVSYIASSSPTGWLNCDGSYHATSSYPNLFAVLGYTYGSATSSQYMRLPDIRGRQITGYGTTTAQMDTMGETGGEINHTMTESELVAHTHTVLASTDGTGVVIATENAGSTGGPITTSSTGTSTPSNVLDPFIVLNYIIKF